MLSKIGLVYSSNLLFDKGSPRRGQGPRLVYLAYVDGGGTLTKLEKARQERFEPMSTADEHPPRDENPIPTVVAHMMIPGVVQVPGDVSVSEAALLLEREQTPCLLVKDTDMRFGLMTPSDIVKKVVAQGLEPHDIEVRTIMTRPVQFIEYDRRWKRPRPPDGRLEPLS